MFRLSAADMYYGWFRPIRQLSLISPVYDQHRMAAVEYFTAVGVSSNAYLQCVARNYLDQRV
jgi:hypothetical protein